MNMEVIRDTQSIQYSRPSQPMAETGNVVSEMERRFQRLQEGAINTMREAQSNPEAEETITKRNAAQILVIALGQMKQFMLIAAVSCLLTAIFGALWGAIGAFIPFAVFAVFTTYMFMKNEKEIKAYKGKFGV